VSVAPLELGLFLIVLALLTLVPLGLLVWAIVDLARRPTWQWEATGQNQVVWAVIIVLISCIGPIIYLAVARPRLEAIAQGGPPAP